MADEGSKLVAGRIRRAARRGRKKDARHLRIMELSASGEYSLDGRKQKEERAEHLGISVVTLYKDLHEIQDRPNPRCPCCGRRLD